MHKRGKYGNGGYGTWPDLIPSQWLRISTHVEHHNICTFICQLYLHKTMEKEI